MRILICDDNVDAALTLQVLISLQRHETLVCDNGAACLEKALTWQPHVALLDIGMPGMSGYAVARALREMEVGKDMLLVAITGWGTPEDVELAREAGFDMHFTKPADTAKLLSLVNRRASPA